MLHSMTNLNRRIVAVATGQLGLLSRQQAHDIGVSDTQLRNRVTSGFLLHVGINTYRLPGAPGGAMADLRALIMDLGRSTFASGRTAAALHGFDGFILEPPFDVTILRGRNVRRIGHRIHTTVSLDLVDRTRVGDLPTTSAARTLIDLARSESVERLTIALDSGLRDRRFSEQLVHRRIVALRSAGRFGIPRLLEAIEGVEAIRGGQSFLERQFLGLLSEAGIPLPETQPVLARAGGRLVRVDFRFVGTPIVVEVLGYRYHRTTKQMGRDAERMNALLAAGLRPYQFTYEQVTRSPGDVLREVRGALATQEAA
jgi:hypothetical protein